MKVKCASRALLCLLLLVCSVRIYAQDKDTEKDDDTPNPKKSKLLTGFYVGAYFPNKYSAANYTGYGFSPANVRNSFLDGAMYQKLVNEYGGANGSTDYVAQALGVDAHQWAFTESDMPQNLRYVPSILLGFNFKVPVGKKDALLLNINAARLSLEGNFSITTFKPRTGGSTNPAVDPNINIFVIRGKEQRLQFEVGYQRIFGGDDKFSFLVDLGLVGTLAKFDRNWITINNLVIDLPYYYQNPTINPFPLPTRVPLGFGIGAFAGLGANIEVNPKVTVQLLYTLSHEKVNFGASPTLKLQHGVGFRLYYNL